MGYSHRRHVCFTSCRAKNIEKRFIPMIFIQLLFCWFIISLYRFNEAQHIGASLKNALALVLVVYERRWANKTRKNTLKCSFSPFLFSPTLSETETLASEFNPSVMVWSSGSFITSPSLKVCDQSTTNPGDLNVTVAVSGSLHLFTLKTIVACLPCTFTSHVILLQRSLTSHLPPSPGGRSIIGHLLPLSPLSSLP